MERSRITTRPQVRASIISIDSPSSVRISGTSTAFYVLLATESGADCRGSLANVAQSREVTCLREKLVKIGAMMTVHASIFTPRGNLNQNYREAKMERAA